MLQEFKDNELWKVRTPLCDIMEEELGREAGSARKLMTTVKDRPGHDRRYAIDASKIERELGWVP